MCSFKRKLIASTILCSIATSAIAGELSVGRYANRYRDNNVPEGINQEENRYSSRYAEMPEQEGQYRRGYSSYDASVMPVEAYSAPAQAVENAPAAIVSLPAYSAVTTVPEADAPANYPVVRKRVAAEMPSVAAQPETPIAIIPKRKSVTQAPSPARNPERKPWRLWRFFANRLPGKTADVSMTSSDANAVSPVPAFLVAEAAETAKAEALRGPAVTVAAPVAKVTVKPVAANLAAPSATSSNEIAPRPVSFPAAPKIAASPSVMPVSASFVQEPRAVKVAEVTLHKNGVPIAQDQEIPAVKEPLPKVLPSAKRLSPSTIKALNKVVKPAIPEPEIGEVDPEYITIAHGSKNMLLAADEEKKAPSAKGKGKKKALKSDIPGVDLSVDEDSPSRNDSAELLQQAYNALTLGELEVATSLYKQALAQEPDNSDALFGLASLYQRNRENGLARDLYAKLLKKDPGNMHALNNFLVLMGDEAPEAAIAELRKLEAINPGFSPIPAQIGMIYNKLQDSERAIRYLSKAIMLSPDNISYRYNLAVLYDKGGKRQQAALLYRSILDAGMNGAILPAPAQKINERLIYISAK